MDVKRRQFIAALSAMAGATVCDGWGMFPASAHARKAEQFTTERPSRDLADYQHIRDVIPSKDMKRYFPLIVDACADPRRNYLSKIPFLIELEVAKIWNESLFEWDALSSAGAAGLQQMMARTARQYGLTVAKTTGLATLHSAISEYGRLRSETATKQQQLYRLVDSGKGSMSGARIDKINRGRAELFALDRKRKGAYRTLKKAKKDYVNTIHGMSEGERRKMDARFVPELLIPVGVKHVVRNIMECKRFFGGSVEMNVWRGVAAYNAGMKRAKTWEGLPFIEETVNYTRNIVSDLTRALEMKYAYATGDANVISATRKRIRIRDPYVIYTVTRGDNFYTIVREQIMEPYNLPYAKALHYIKDSQGNPINPRDMSIILPNQKFRIYIPSVREK